MRRVIALACVVVGLAGAYVMAAVLAAGDGRIPTWARRRDPGRAQPEDRPTTPGSSRAVTI